MVPSPDPVGTGDGSPPPAVLRVVDFGGPELTDALGGGAQLAAAIASRGGYAPEVELRPVPAAPLGELIAAHGDWSHLLDGAHVAVRSISPDVRAEHPEGSSVTSLGERFRDQLGELVGLVKAAGATFVAINGSTVDPDDHVFSYARSPVTGPLAVHEYNLELIRLSMLDGISVLDVDRIVSQEGGNDNVEGLLDYRQPVRSEIAAELALILEEYGWFDDRPILAQRGKRDRGAA